MEVVGHVALLSALCMTIDQSKYQPVCLKAPNELSS